MNNEVSSKEVGLVKKSNHFDPKWYVEKYPDVAISGLDPAYHFAKYGKLLLRDPGPSFSTFFYLGIRPKLKKKNINPVIHAMQSDKKDCIDSGVVLECAHKLALAGNSKLAVKLAKENLPERLKYSVSLIEANMSLEHGDEKGWLEKLNAYLSEFSISPVLLKNKKEAKIIERLSCVPGKTISVGPLITVIMPAWNAEATIKDAVLSILNQTWRNLQLIVVDDCSVDETYGILQAIASTDSRMKVLRNSTNVGPYVSKNIAVKHAEGDYITGHDADDWAHPERLEKHIGFIQESHYPRASLTYMLRIKPDGSFSSISKLSSFTLDGVARRASISCMFEKTFFQRHLGAWDSVRFGADSEIISRAESLLGDEFKFYSTIGMICLDLDSSLTNDPEHGIRSNNGSLSLSRKLYRDSWKNWHLQNLRWGNSKLDFPQSDRIYDGHEKMVVCYADQVSALSSYNNEEGKL